MPALFASTLLAILFVLSACATQAQLVAPVESYDHLPLDEFSELLGHAVGSGADWPAQPVMVAVVFLTEHNGGYPPFDASLVTMTQERPRGEAPDSAVVTVVLDGLLDDSVQGTWYQLVLEPADAGAYWRVREARVAYRCWPGRGSSEAFSRALCA